VKIARGLLALVLCAGIAGCGGEASDAVGAPSSRLVDFTRAPPYVNAFDIDPESKDFLLTTNRGFYRIDGDGDRVRPVQATIQAAGKTARVGTFLELAVEEPARPGRLLGSGHPDQLGQELPEFLGLIRSGDGGRTWEPVARLGDSDLHKLVFKHGRLYAIDIALNVLLTSRDGGVTFTERFTPPGEVMIDFDVDPADPRRIVASSQTQLYRSTDGGTTWKRLDAGAGIRLAWPAPGALYRARKDGSVQRSANGGTNWSTAGRVGGEPYKFKPIGAQELYLALSDGTIVHTVDGARTWTVAFRP